jgi:hypothetical protein
VYKTAVLAPTSNVCLRIGDLDGVQDEHRRFILVRVEKCPMSSGRGEFYIILHRSACSRGYKRVREGGDPRSHGVSGECVCDSVDPSQGPEELSICLSMCPSSERSLHAPFIASRRCRVTKYWYMVGSVLEKEPRGLGRAFSGGDVDCTIEAWRRYFWHCCYMSR